MYVARGDVLNGTLHTHAKVPDGIACGLHTREEVHERRHQNRTAIDGCEQKRHCCTIIVRTFEVRGVLAILLLKVVPSGPVEEACVLALDSLIKKDPKI